MRIRNKSALVSRKHGIKTKLLVYEYKERFPFLSKKDITNLFHLSEEFVNCLFNEREIVVPSKLNKK